MDCFGQGKANAQADRESLQRIHGAERAGQTEGGRPGASVLHNDLKTDSVNAVGGDSFYVFRG